MTHVVEPTILSTANKVRNTISVEIDQGGAGGVPLDVLLHASSSLEVTNDHVPVRVAVNRNAQVVPPEKNIPVRTVSPLEVWVKSIAARTSKAFPLQVGLSTVHSK